MINHTRTSKPASDSEIDVAANDIFDILFTFDSPKDAAPALCLAHMRLIHTAFAPEDKTAAIKAVEAHCRLIIEQLNEGWQ